MSSPILVLGARGQIGRALMVLLGKHAVGLTSSDLDLTNTETIMPTLEQHNASAVINAAGYTAVDAAENDEAKAMAINGDAPGIIARWCAGKNIPLIHYSTDYVFDGSKQDGWKEDDTPSPLNIYGRSKLDGEAGVTYSGAKHFILRTSWVFSENGKNFVNTMLHLGADREVISVVDDQIGCPSYAGDIATATLTLLDKARTMDPFPSGIYHLCNSEKTNWFTFAEAIFKGWEGLGNSLEVKEVKPIHSAEFPTAAQRPLHSVLDCSQLKESFGISLPSWQDALGRCLKKKHETH